MTIYFRNTPLREPFTFESVGNHWDQEEIDRADGYPLYHYLQTERGIGEIKIQRKTYVLCEGQGVLIAPGIKHSYRRKSKEWLTRFATFTGVMENGINILTGNRNIIFTEKNTGLAIAKQLDMVLKKFETPPVDAVELSVDCYRLLMNFMDNPCVGNMAEEETYKKYVKPTIEKIETEFDADLTVNELANSVYITPQYLSRLFIRFLGISARSPHQRGKKISACNPQNGNPGNSAPGGVWQRQPLYCHVQKENGSDTRFLPGRKKIKVPLTRRF